jgi:Na+-transporting NADH:ubiquinone oxidoreductase subunit NqrD
MLVGAVLMIMGMFFTLQGAGVIMWPATSPMVDNSGWISKGLMTALAGAAVILIGRRAGTKA